MKNTTIKCRNLNEKFLKNMKKIVKKIFFLATLCAFFLLIATGIFVYVNTKTENISEKVIEFVEKTLKEKGKNIEKCDGALFYFPQPGFIIPPKRVNRIEFLPTYALCEIPLKDKEEGILIFEKIRNYLLKKLKFNRKIEESISPGDFFYTTHQEDWGKKVYLNVRLLPGKSKPFSENSEKKYCFDFYYFDFSQTHLDQRKTNLIGEYYVKKDPETVEILLKKPQENLTIVIGNTYLEGKSLWIEGVVGCCDGGKKWIAKIENGKFKKILETSTPHFLCKELAEKNVPSELMGENYYCWDEETIKYKDYLQKIEKPEF